AVLSTTLAVLLPFSVDPSNSRNLTLSVAPAVSARTQKLPVYVSADVVPTQFGWSFRRQNAGPVFVFWSLAENSPVCPPDTRASVTPRSGASQPAVSPSKPELRTRFSAVAAATEAHGAASMRKAQCTSANRAVVPRLGNARWP